VREIPLGHASPSATPLQERGEGKKSEHRDALEHDAYCCRVGGKLSSVCVCVDGDVDVWVVCVGAERER
jgi:hypothetical protein